MSFRVVLAGKCIYESIHDSMSIGICIGKNVMIRIQQLLLYISVEQVEAILCNVRRCFLIEIYIDCTGYNGWRSLFSDRLSGRCLIAFHGRRIFSCMHAISACVYCNEVLLHES